MNCFNLKKTPTDNLSGTGNENGRGEDSNTNENIDNVFTSNDYLNVQAIDCSQTGRLDAGVDIGEICVCWDKSDDVSNHVNLT